MYISTSNALWWVMNGRAEAPPAMACSIDGPEGIAEGHAHYHFEKHGMAEHAMGLLHILLSEFNGAKGGTAYGDELAEGDEQVDDREGDGHGRKGEGAYAVADIDAGNDLVQRHDDHAQYGRDGKGEEKAAYALRPHHIGFRCVVHAVLQSLKKYGDTGNCSAGAGFFQRNEAWRKAGE